KTANLVSSQCFLDDSAEVIARFHREIERAYVDHGYRGHVQKNPMPDGSRITWGEVTGPATGCYLVPAKPIRDILPALTARLNSLGKVGFVLPITLCFLRFVALLEEMRRLLAGSAQQHVAHSDRSCAVGELRPRAPKAEMRSIR